MKEKINLVKINETCYNMNHIIGIGTVQFVEPEDDEEILEANEGIAVESGWFFDVIISDNLTEYVYGETFEACNKSRNQLLLAISNGKVIEIEEG